MTLVASVEQVAEGSQGGAAPRGSLAPLALALLAPVSLWGVLLIVLPPGRQDFPLNDDWAFARGAFAFARGEGVHYYGWASMPQLGQWVWACPWVWVLGESHAVLRLSTVALAVLGVAAFYDLLRGEKGLPPAQAAFTAACLGLNPLFFLLAATFHTDVPALAFSLLALAFYARGLRSGRGWWWAGGTALALLAVTTRQNAVVVPLTAGLLLWRQPGRRRRALWLLGTLLPLAVAFAADFWFGRRPDVIRLAPDLRGVVSTPFKLFMVAHALGLSALPLLWRPRGGRWLTFFSALSLMLGGASLLLALFDSVLTYGGLFPYVGNLITPWGSQGQNSMVVGRRPLLLYPLTRFLLTLGGCLAGAALVARLKDRCSDGLKATPLVLFSAFHFLLLLLSLFLYDRYLLVFLPGALALAAGAPAARLPWKPMLATLGLFGLLSLSLTHDWLSWNAARWELGRRAVDRGIAPSEIEGGFEWDGWFSPGGAVGGSPAFPRQKVPPPRGLTLPLTRQQFPQVTGRFALAFSQPPDSRTLDDEPYRLWLIPGENRFFLVEQEPAGKKGP